MIHRSRLTAGSTSQVYFPNTKTKESFARQAEVKEALMSGRGKGRFGRGRFGGRFHKKKSGNYSDKKSNDQPKERKVLADYVFRLGTSKQASEFDLVSQYIINHIRKEYTNGDDIGDALEDRKDVDLNGFKPRLELSQNQDDIERDKEDQENEKIFEAQVRVFVQRKAVYETNKRKAFALIYEQCHKTLQAKLKARTNYDQEIKGNPIAMLKAIQEHTMSYQENRYDAKIMIDALRSMLFTKQRDDEDLVDFTRRFKAARDFFEAQLGGKNEARKDGQDRCRVGRNK